MRTAQRDQPTRARTVFGIVNSSGAVLAGLGFTVTKTGTGQFTVRFAEPFRITPTCVAAAAMAGVLGLTVSTADPASLGISTFTTNTGALTDAAFTFTAEGIAR